MILRQQPRISYYEPEEPSWDAYIFCDKCGDYAYEYCSVHGPLLVIPDDTVPAKSPYPPYVPSAALTIPHVFLHIAPSIIPGAGLGIFSTLTLPRGVRFGPYKGTKTTDINSMYCWQIYDNDHKPSHVIDAADPNKSNWMRYVNCARHWSEQNLVAYQYNGELYYRTVKLIPRFTELMVFYGSEFASMMGINLSTYNSPISYHKSGTRGKKRKSTDVSQNAQQIEVNEITKKTKLLNNTFTGPANNTYKALDTNVSKNKPTISNGNNLTPKSNLESKSVITVNSIVNCKQVNNLPEELNILPNDKNHTKNVILQNNKLPISKVCYNNPENEISEQCLPKSTDTVVPSTSTEDISDKGNKSIVGNKDIPENYNFSCPKFQYKCVENNDSIKNLRKHTGEKPYICDLCEYSCSQRGSLNSHIKHKHTTEKNFSCHICQYKCVRKGHLNVHLRKHTGEKPYICDLCEYSCSVRGNLNNHIKHKHTNEKNFSCRICQYKCVQKSYLNAHLRKHTGEKPYTCDLCEYSCSVRGSLKSHIKHKHTNEKNFSCHICQYKCVQRGDLNVHLRKHTGEKPYTCDLCEYSCSVKGSLNSHIKHKHTNEKTSHVIYVSTNVFKGAI
ncbi:hypothetical protein K1T71_005858 [Dendrolimus kikuchii]|uniref:Uncharacterized protein n=1 Tax=Dendrolimus kikuchii TaxID=765133 RepID=A0ACC1D2C9_9NEOP|nr:hypothetical protein K1T71_005858 [Dendrolimus kikuchii]